jgi:ubiquinone/menaquinone biosynthesis C-methylase UbiE
MTTDATPAFMTTGRVLHRATAYDVLVWLLTHGRESAFRRSLARFAQLSTGESVLDVGCGTGSLAIEAKRQVGPGGRVAGIDASPEMIGRAASKAAKARLDVRFQQAVVEALPFDDGTFDVVLSTLMLHHLPRIARTQCVREIRRVLRPGGRVLIVDFDRGQGHGLLRRVHRHGHVAAREIVTLLGDAGFQPTDEGPAGMGDMRYVLATSPLES